MHKEDSAIQAMECYSVIKKNIFTPFSVICVDLAIVKLSEDSQRKANIMRYHLYAESKKRYRCTYLQNRSRKTPMVTGNKGEGLNGKIGLTNNTTAYIIDNNKNLLYSTGISTQCSVMICIGKEWRKKKQNQSQYVYEFNSSTFLHNWN